MCALSFTLQGVFIIGTVKDIMKKDIDLGLIISTIFCFFLGIVKLFQTENKIGSIIFGSLLIGLSIMQVIFLILKKGKRV